MDHQRWFRTSGAVIELGISRATLQRRKSDGYFLKGKHWITGGPHLRSPVLWNVDEIREVMAHWEGPAKSEAAK